MTPAHIICLRTFVTLDINKTGTGAVHGLIIQRELAVQTTKFLVGEKK